MNLLDRGSGYRMYSIYRPICISLVYVNLVLSTVFSLSSMKYEVRNEISVARTVYDPHYV